ncbi:hypothetical protein [Streptomyces sp. NBC_01264]|uniref:hypothetical protein n=1 Tax=Streptomyces sp. NBC_01264 TaxID=2903804 RepID=UPI00225766D9|nr:hypothetical protein [Streptomyces sp. NBC_01264]MCX4780926.1 hypothetical protein [Streptomyces sp. NBC_01264]
MNAATKAIAPARLRLVAEQVPASHKTFDYIFEADLAALVAEYDVRVVTSEITDPGFFGMVVVANNGRIILTLSPNLGDFELDFFPRYLLCAALGLPMGSLPEPFKTEVHAALPAVAA